MQVAGHFGQLEAVCGRQGQHDRVLRRRGLQLEVEGAAEALAQRQAPGAVDAAAEGRVDDELHAAGFVEEALEHDGVLGGQCAEGCTSGGEVVDELQGRSHIDAGDIDGPAQGRLQSILQARLDFLAQARYGGRQLMRATRCLAQPERNRWRLAVRVLDAHGTALDTQDPVRDVAELEYVALQALDREVFVDRADELRLRLQHHAIVGVVRDRSSRCERREPGAAPPSQQPIDGIMMNESAMPAPPGREPFREHPHDLVEFLTLHVAEGIRASDEGEQSILVPFARGDFGHDLLGEHVQRFRGHDETVQLPTAHGVQQRGALDQVVARQRKQSPPGRAADGMPRPAHPLQEGGNGAGR